MRRRNILLKRESLDDEAEETWEYTDLLTTASLPLADQDLCRVVEWSDERDAWIYWDMPRKSIACGKDPEKIIDVLYETIGGY